MCVGMAWAELLPTEPLKVSQILPSDGTPENQFYVRATKSDGQYWTSATVNTNDVANAGKFAFYAVPGIVDCYYIYSVDAKKWVNYNKTNRNNQKSFVALADNFDANAYWKITASTKKNDNTSCYQLNPTVYTTNSKDAVGIQTDRYANWFQGADGSSTLGLWQEGATQDEGSAWSFVSVDVSSDLKLLLSQRIAVATEILANNATFTKGENILTAENVTSVITSPYTSTKEGSIANMVDGNAETIWHSAWENGEKLNGSHYFVADIGDLTPELLSFAYSRRNNADNDHTTRWAVYGVPANEDGVSEGSRDGLTLLAIVSTPFGNKAEAFNNLAPFKTQGFKKFRFYSEATNQNRGYFHVGEFQLNGNTLADSNEDRVKELAAAVATAEALENPTEADIATLNEKISLFILSDEDRARGTALLALAGVGYPTATSEARIALQNVVNNDASTLLELNEAIANFKACTDIALPENGKAYQFALVANDNDLTNYKLVASGTSLSVSTTSEATTFYCVKYTNVDGNERYAFVSPEGNFLGYHTLSGDYRTHEGNDKRLQNDISFASMLSFTSNMNQGTEEKRFGTVAMKVDNRILESKNKDGYFIMNFSDNNKAFDKSSAPFFDGSFTSAIKVTEVTSYEPSNDVLVAVSTINPLIKGYVRVGEGVNKYSYTYGENSGNAFADFETLVKATDAVIEDANYSFAINMPTAGFYRVKSMNSGLHTENKGKFLQNNDGNLTLTATKDVNSIMYLDGSNMIVNYATGTYLNKYNTFEAKGAAGSAWTFLENAEVVGTYALDNPADTQGGEQYFLSDWTGDMTYGNNDKNAAWMFEEVTEIPVTVSAAGYASFYAPVAVTLPAEGLTAYYVSSINGDYAVFTAIEGGVIPANTGVLLAGAAETYELTIAEDAEAIEGNMLNGTVASTYIEGAANKNYYVLSKPAESEVGLYKAMLNKNATGEEGTTHFLNNGFKAYLPLETAGQSAVKAFFFNFGGETTGVDAVEVVKPNAPIYDLSGRRVLSTVKGGIYIQNGKKFIVK